MHAALSLVPVVVAAYRVGVRCEAASCSMACLDDDVRTGRCGSGCTVACSGKTMCEEAGAP